jgi:DNA-binding transcriptional ArsR family regulator
MDPSVALPLSGEWVILTARRMRVIAEPTRMQILLLLEQREASVEDIADFLGLSHQRTSRHLNLLYAAGILARRPDGSRALYSLADFTSPALVRAAAASMTGWVDELAELARPSQAA